MAFINDEEINDIRQKADIVDIISEYLPLTQKGRNFVSICPFHDDHSPSMVVSREKQIFNCFTCRTGGNVFSFIMKYENVSFVESVQIVAKKIGYNLKQVNFIEETDSKFKEEFEIMNMAHKYFLNNLNTDYGLDAKKYLKDRGIDEAIIKEFKLGLAINETDSLYKLLTNKKYGIDAIENVGLVNKNGLDVYDVFNNRIMIPLENASGKVVGFTGRIFHDEDMAKYINTKETVIYHKSNILFNYYNAKNAIRNDGKVIVVEGNMDAIKVSASGVKNIVALMGVAISKEQVSILKKLRVPVILMLDNDTAGLDATVKLGDILIDNGVDTLIVRLSGAKDPDEYIRRFGIDAFKDNINHAIKYMDFKLEYLKSNKNLNNMEDLIVYVKSVLKGINNKDELTRDLVISKLSNDYKIDKELLKRELVYAEKPEKTVVEEVKEVKKKTKYEIATSKILFAMMMDAKYITIYRNKLGYFKDKIDRIIASEIVYYNNMNKGINIADFTSYIMNNEEAYNRVLNIISDNENFDVELDEFNLCIDAILCALKKDEIKVLKSKIAKEMDINKKVEMLSRLTEIKKEV
ncbi:MAG: DNA primase [Bacilli bacterium]